MDVHNHRWAIEFELKNMVQDLICPAVAEVKGEVTPQPEGRVLPTEWRQMGRSELYQTARIAGYSEKDIAAAALPARAIDKAVAALKKWRSPTKGKESYQDGSLVEDLIRSGIVSLLEKN